MKERIEKERIIDPEDADKFFLWIVEDILADSEEDARQVVKDLIDKTYGKFVVCIDDGIWIFPQVGKIYDPSLGGTSSKMESIAPWLFIGTLIATMAGRFLLGRR